VRICYFQMLYQPSLQRIGLLKMKSVIRLPTGKKSIKIVIPEINNLQLPAIWGLDFVYQ